MGFSQLKIPKICEYCKQPFEAKTLSTRCCSKACSNNAYKARIKNMNEQVEIQAKTARKSADIAEIQSRPYISIPEATVLFGVSKDTLRRLINKGKLPAYNLGERLTRISRVELEAMFAPIQQPEPIPSQPKKYSIEECYTMKEIQIKFGVSEKTLYSTIKRLEIPKIPQGKFVYVPKELIDKVFASNTNQA